jgi:hypothetical protein
MKNLALCASLLATLSFSAGCDDDDDFDDDVEATLTVINESDFVIVELYLTDVGSPTWGRNLVAGDPLDPDEEIVLGVKCDFYDALLVDEEGVECELEGIDLCLNDATWYIYNDTCVAFEAALQARKQAAAAAEGAAAGSAEGAGAAAGSAAL